MFLVGAYMHVEIKGQALVYSLGAVHLVFFLGRVSHWNLWLTY